ncbi:hypothetical protein ASD79_07875 [Caulobacter sp. Root655]|uniref:YDG domain-containing protein n=1 Tax=Caulobacter sp. Root655 TaxID=1736578 RepID=UPI0006FFC1C3|nr:YDG domain-containing protein [Caulobacter sp. Root655]KRA60149.1 hypothetical protein ASD79_07875 [Caulobacter sp. Root655]
MTPSSIRPISSRPTPGPARRTTLLAASALCGVAAMLAQPALAGTLPGIPGAGNITVSSGGSQPFITFPDAITLQIDLNAPRTVINWTDLHLSSGDAMNFLFDSASDIVLNKTTSQIRFDTGSVVTGKVGAATAGNVWFYSPQGVIISPGATMTAGGFLFSRGSGIVDAGFVDAGDPLANLRAATDALIRVNTISSATSASIDASGNVLLSASSGALNVAAAVGATVGVSTTSGSITASEVTATSGAATVAAGGPGATVSSIAGATGVTVSSGVNTSVGSASTTTSGDIVLSSGGSVSLTLGNSARDILITAPLIFLSTADAGRDAILTGDTGVTVTNRIFAGDDIELTASNGDIAAGGAFLRSTGLGASDDAHILLRSDNGAVTATNTLQTQGTGAQAGDITVQAATTASVGSANATRDLKVTGVTASLTSGSAARDIFVTATTGGATVTTAATAGDDVEVTATTGAVSAGGATLKSTGVGAADDGHVLVRSTGSSVTVNVAQTLGTGASAGDVIISAAGNAGLTTGSATRDLSVNGQTASLNTGSAARDIFVSSTTGNAIVVTQVVAGDDVEVTTVSGDVLASGATLTSTGAGAGGSDGHVLARSSSGSVDVGTATTQGTAAAAGDVTLNAGDTVTATSVEATRDVSVTGPFGINVASATAGRDITLIADVGDAILGKALLTGSGAGHDLLVMGDGNATLGGPDYLSITAANTFSRTGGNTGEAVILSATAQARVYLDTSDAIDRVEGRSVDITVNSGPVTFSTLTAQNGIYAEALDGALTVGEATTVNGGLELSAAGGDLTINTLARGAGLVHLQTDGLLDATTASLISTGGDLELAGGTVDVGTLQAGGLIVGVAIDGNIDVQSANAGVAVQIAALVGDAFVDTAEADLGVVVQAGGDALVNFAKATDVTGIVMVAADGDATLRGAEAPAGISVEATNKATFGADDKASITAANYAVTDPACGCGSGGLQVISNAGDVVVNINSASNGIAVVGAAIDGDVTVVQKTGDLKIDEVAGYNITLEAMAGTLETDFATSSGGDYKITAHDFLGDALTPFLFNGEIHDVTITDTLGDLDLGSLALHAGRRLTIAAQDGAVLGSAQLDAGTGAHDGVVAVTADAISLDTVLSDGDVSLTAATGDVTLGAAGVHADRLLFITALSGALTSLGQLDAGLGAGAHDGEVNVSANAMTLGAVASDGDVGLSAGTGGVNLGSVVHADRALSIIALNGTVTGAGQLDAGSGTTFGDVEVTADAIGLDTVRANRDVNLNAGTGLVNVATSLNVDRTYALIGGDFSAAALAPLGAKAGTWTILDQVGDFDFSSKTLHYGSSIALNVFDGNVIGGDITSDAGTVFVQADGGSLGALYAGGGQVTAIGDVGGMAVGSAQGVGRITVTAVNGTASLGSAILTGPGIHGLTVRATNGDVVLGAATPGAITAGNIVTSTGSSLVLAASTPTGKVDVNLDHTTNANLTTLSGPLGVKVQVVNGSLGIGTASATSGQVSITGTNGAVTVNQLTAGGTSLVSGGGETRLVSANVTGGGGITVRSTGAGVRLGDATPGRVIGVSTTLSLAAAADITQQGAIQAGALVANAGTGVVLLGDNQVAHLSGVNVASGGFAYHGAAAFDIVAPIVAAGQTVDLRSDLTIGQAPLGLITAQKLTGSSVGGAIFDLANPIAELGDFTNTTGRLKLVSNRALTISGTVLSTGILSIASHGGMTIAGTGTVRANGAGDAVVLASDGVFTNARGADAVIAASGGGRWLIYTQAFGDPQGSTAGNTFNGLVGKSFYGAAYDFAASGFHVGLNNGNRFVYAYQPTITVTPDSRTVTYSGAIPSLSATVTGLVNGDLFTDAWLGALVISGATSKNVGTYTLNAVTGGLTSDLNYAFAAGPAGSLRIDPKALSATLTADDKTYDGTATASGSIGLTGMVAGDTVSASGTYLFADKNAGTGKTVTASGVALSGADAGNYTLVPLATTQADILKKGLTGALVAANKTYDGTTAASGSIGLTGVVAGDAVSASGTYAFADKNVGTGKTVTVSAAALSGLDAANYDLGGVSGGLADILRRQVTVAADSAFKPFGLVDPTLTYRITVGDLAAGDAFTGGLARDPGEVPGGYGITLGSLGLSTNYDLTFTGAVFTIRPFPSNEAGGSMTIKHLVQSPDFTLDWDPEVKLTTGGQACPGEGCPPQAAMSGSGGGLAVAALR